MSRSIYVDHYGELTESQREDIDKLFKDTHEAITITANFCADNDWKGEKVVCTHGTNFVGKGSLEEFIEIPCHWDEEHAIETAKDIVDVLLRLQIDKFRVTHSY